jgi:6-phosphofructokinase 1
MNAVLRGVVKLGARRGVQVYGVQRGFEGLIEGDMHPLYPRDVDVIGGFGGSELGCRRSQVFLTESGREAAAMNLKEFDGLIVVGGNGSMKGASVFGAESGVPVIGVPASIDNDIGCTSAAIGVDTALNTIVEACDRISDTARSHKRVFVLEVMGRDCGYLAQAGAVATGADAVLFREQGRTREEIMSQLGRLIDEGFSEERGKKQILILKAEGVTIPTNDLTAELQRRVDLTHPEVTVRSVVLGYLVRGGTPSYRDRMIGGRFGVAALEALLAGKTNQMVAWRPFGGVGEKTVDPTVKLVPLDEVLRETARLLDGSSTVTMRRVAMMEGYAGVLAV